MDEETKALAREALDTYKRHVDILEKNYRAVTGWTFPIRIWGPVIVLGLLAWLLFHFLGVV